MNKDKEAVLERGRLLRLYQTESELRARAAERESAKADEHQETGGRFRGNSRPGRT